MNEWIKNNSILTLVIILLVVGVVIVKLENVSKPQIPNQTITRKTYIDPDNHFTITVPSSWTPTINHGSEESGLNTAHPVSQGMEITSFKSSDKVGINVLVYEGPASCDSVQKSNTTFDGLPAVYNPHQYAWTIYTTDATYVIGYFYPGLPVYHSPQMAASQAQMDTNQNRVDSVIKTFIPKNRTPLNC